MYLYISIYIYILVSSHRRETVQVQVGPKATRSGGHGGVPCHQTSSVGTWTFNAGKRKKRGEIGILLRFNGIFFEYSSDNFEYSSDYFNRDIIEV